MLDRAGDRGFPATQRQRVVLIGGGGFIGSHLALHLAATGHEVIVVDDLVINNMAQVTALGPSTERSRKVATLNLRLALMREAGVSLLVIDASDRRRLGEALLLSGSDIVVHLAAIAHADRADRAPYEAFQSGLASLAATLDIASGGVQRLVYFSSSMVYGDFVTAVADEQHPLCPKGVYGALKLAGEAMCRAHHRVRGIPCTIIRPSALYGPRCISQRITQRFIENARDGLPLRVEGDGEEKIDFTYIDDLVQGTCLAMMSDAAIGETFNITCGNARSLLELARVVQRSYPNTTIEFTPRDQRRPRRGTLSIDKARRLLGYAPRVQIEDGVGRCITEAERAEEGSARVGRGRTPGAGRNGLVSQSERPGSISPAATHDR